MARLALLLAARLGKPVADMTALPGQYDFTLAWTPSDEEISPFAAMLTPDLRQRLADTADLQGPALVTALREQLGLRLEPSKVAVEQLVVEDVSRPSPN